MENEDGKVKAARPEKRAVPAGWPYREETILFLNIDVSSHRPNWPRWMGENTRRANIAGLCAYRHCGEASVEGRGSARDGTIAGLPDRRGTGPPSLNTG